MRKFHCYKVGLFVIKNYMKIIFPVPDDTEKSVWIYIASGIILCIIIIGSLACLGKNRKLYIFMRNLL